MIRVKRVTLLLALVLATATACSSNNGNTGTASQSIAPSGTTAAPKDNGTGTEAGPNAKYEPAIELSTVRFQRDGPEYPGNDNIDNNVWYRAYESELGIKVKNLWTVSDTPEIRDQKMSVTIAGGSLPDIIPVNARELQMLVEADMVEDLTSVYEQFASPLVKENLEVNNKIALEAASYNGKLMAIPNTSRGGGVDGVPMIWLRADWLANLGLEPPKTMQDVLEISRAFTEDDPDKNGQNDTFGLAIGKNVYDGFAGVEGFFAGYHAYPHSTTTTMWVKNEATGQLEYAGIQPQVKEGLRALNGMFKAKQIDPEFAVKDGVQVAETVTSGKIGLLFGQFWVASWPLNDMNASGLKADWKPYPLVSIDGEPAKTYLQEPVTSEFYAIKKGTAHPEAAFKMLNFYYEKIYGEGQEPEKYHTVADGDKKIEVFGTAVLTGGKLDNNIRQYEMVTEALASKDPSKLNAEYTVTYDRLLKYAAGEDNGAWFLGPIFGQDGAYAIVKHDYENQLIVSNEFYGTPTPTMVERGSTLKEMEHEAYTKIIMGAAPVDDFDKFVSDWKKLGGDAITAEVNEWASSKQ